MRYSSVAAAICLSISAVVAGFTSAPASDAPASTVSAAPQASAGKPAASVSGDAAARHAKRTACLKDAKTRKLVAAEKASFLKNCIAAP